MNCLLSKPSTFVAERPTRSEICNCGRTVHHHQTTAMALQTTGRRAWFYTDCLGQPIPIFFGLERNREPLGMNSHAAPELRVN